VSVKSIIDELSSVTSRLEKEKILSREKNNVLLQNVLKATYNPYVNYFQKKIPSFTTVNSEKKTLSDFIEKCLVDLSSRKVTGNKAIQYLSNWLSSLNEDDAIVATKIIQRDLDCGIAIPTINKIWPGLIPTFDVMLCHKDISGIKYPAYAQIKYDGAGCHAYFDGEKLSLFSRNGKLVEFHNVFNKSAMFLMKKDETWDGEIVFRDPNNLGKLLDRKTSNGLFNKGLKGTITKEEANNAIFICWDIVDFTSIIPYKERYGELVKRWKLLSDLDKSESKIWVVDSTIVYSEEQAFEYYNRSVQSGNEGAVVKNLDGVWEGKRSKNCGKIKANEEADLVVVDWCEGTGKYKGLMGSLVCETRDGKLRVNVGTGWSDEQRMVYTKDNTLGKILTVAYNQIIEDKNTGVKSLFLPRAIEFREDKTIANSLDELK